MIATRHAKVALLAASSLCMLIIALNNAVLDYPSNYGFVKHVLSMDTLFSGQAQTWRALADPTPEDGTYWLHHLFYWSIIGWEATASALCGRGAWKLWTRRKAAASAFNRAKSLAVYGLALNLLLWFVAFISIGAEWFLMWQSSSWNGQEAAGRMFMIFGIILLVVLHRDDEIEAG
jgi:predicted small integral membrane protein